MHEKYRELLFVAITTNNECRKCSSHWVVSKVNVFIKPQRTPRLPAREQAGHARGRQAVRWAGKKTQRPKSSVFLLQFSLVRLLAGELRVSSVHFVVKKNF